jgi:RimJ/RimL family protein N-acetyltransferase
MFELTSAQFALARPLFSATHYGVLAAGTLEGGHAGRVFVDNLEEPQAALLCTRVGYYFLAGRPDRSAFTAWLPRIFTGELAPRQMAMLNDPQVLLFYPTPGWRAPLAEAFGALEQPMALVKKRMLLPSGTRCPVPHLPDGFQLKVYDLARLQSNPGLGGEASLFYGSHSNFLARSLGICLLNPHGQIASACHAVFTGAQEAEISIFTAPQYRRRGLAYATAAAFITTCQERAITPVWGCFPDNLPSVALARKLGFADDIDQDFYLFQHLYGGSASEISFTNTATA